MINLINKLSERDEGVDVGMSYLKWVASYMGKEGTIFLDDYGEEHFFMKPTSEFHEDIQELADLLICIKNMGEHHVNIEDENGMSIENPDEREKYDVVQGLCAVIRHMIIFGIIDEEHLDGLINNLQSSSWPQGTF